MYYSNTGILSIWWNKQDAYATDYRTYAETLHIGIGTYAEAPYLVGVNGCLPLQVVYDLRFCVSPGDKEYYLPLQMVLEK
ncbi:MAG: hypothetical protein F6K17_11745 [Okeania sp. SIO3C4]|nr:hypothetical protein [Okeania sp. SIO3C4]